ncbi:MAG: hypothetical protein MMC23_004378 [Stictis urceolatum]|nr:hypothetical protein [Stictis urceolata]
MVAQRDDPSVVIDSSTGNVGGIPTSLPPAIIPGSDGPELTTARTDIAKLTTSPAAPPITASTTTTTITHTPSAASQTAPASSSASPSHNGIPTSTLIPAIVVPVVILLIAIPALIFCWFHRRNKKLERDSRMSSPDMQSSSTNAALLHKQSQPSLSFTPFTDGEKGNNGSYEVYETQRSMENEHGGEAIALNARNRSWSDGRSPSPMMPAEGVTKRPLRPERPKARPKTNEAWPLPAHTNLPEPEGGSISGTNKPLPPPMPAQDSTHLPPMNFHEPLSMHDSLPTDSSLYDLSATTNFPSPPLTSAMQFAPAAAAAAPRAQSHKKRESDLVSELSQNEEPTRPSGRRDTDAISVISAMTSRSRSQRRKSNQSAISALSPEEPEMPMRPFPRM